VSERLQETLRWKQLALERIGEGSELRSEVILPLGVLREHALGHGRLE
jgi:hypothetical protein